MRLPVQAILLGGLALKRRWQEKRKAAGITEAVTPNIVCSSAVHVGPFPLKTDLEAAIESKQYSSAEAASGPKQAALWWFQSKLMTAWPCKLHDGHNIVWSSNLAMCMVELVGPYTDWQLKILIPPTGLLGEALQLL